MICQKPVKKIEAPTTSKSNKRLKSGENDGSQKRKQTKIKKDPNAPKRAMSAFMFFSKMEREVSKHSYIYFVSFYFLCFEFKKLMHFTRVQLQNVKKDIPSISFKEMGRVLGERWNKLSGFVNMFRICYNFISLENAE